MHGEVPSTELLKRHQGVIWCPSPEKRDGFPSRERGICTSQVTMFVSLLKWHITPNTGIFLATEAKIVFLVHTLGIFFPAKLHFFIVSFFKNSELCK